MFRGVKGEQLVQRRTVSWNPGTGMLSVGDHSARLPDRRDNTTILRTYLELVRSQRSQPIQDRVELRRDDVIVLAELLDLDDDALEDELADLLGLDPREASSLRRRLLRHRVAAAAFSVGILAGAPAAFGTDDDPARSPGTSDLPSEQVRFEPASHEPVSLAHPLDRPITPPVAIGSPIEQPVEPPVTSILAPVAEPAPASEPVADAEAGSYAEVSEAATEPEPQTRPETEIGHSVRYERDPDHVPPEGVEIGDAMVVERDPG